MTRTLAADGDSPQRKWVVDAAPVSQGGSFRFWESARSWVGIAGPVAAGLFFIFLADLSWQHLSAERARALKDAAFGLDMRASELARRLDAAFASAPSRPAADILREVLAADPGLVGGEALLADATGQIIARASGRPTENLTLATLLSSAPPLTILADKA